MQVLHSSQIPQTITNWTEQLAELTRHVWTGADGKFIFPYTALKDPTHWETVVAQQWSSGLMHSWVAVIDGRIVSHAALVNKGTHWELGRLMAHGAPHGTTHALCEIRLAFCREMGIHARMECTQAHTRAQWHAQAVGMRFAGIGFLDVIDGVNWDIIFFDTLVDRPAFNPVAGLLGDPLGVELQCADKDQTRLREISHILSTYRGGALPPTKFHVLSELFEQVQRIILLNTIAARH